MHLDCELPLLGRIGFKNKDLVVRAGVGYCMYLYFEIQYIIVD